MKKGVSRRVVNLIAEGQGVPPLTSSQHVIPQHIATSSSERESLDKKQIGFLRNPTFDFSSTKITKAPSLEVIPQIYVQGNRPPRAVARNKD